jgi:hypothetical protein
VTAFDHEPIEAGRRFTTAVAPLDRASTTMLLDEAPIDVMDVKSAELNVTGSSEILDFDEDATPICLSIVSRVRNLKIPDLPTFDIVQMDRRRHDALPVDSRLRALTVPIDRDRAYLTIGERTGTVRLELPQEPRTGFEQNLVARTKSGVINWRKRARLFNLCMVLSRSSVYF